MNAVTVMPGYEPTVLASLTVEQLRSSAAACAESAERSRRVALELIGRGVDREQVAQIRDAENRWWESHRNVMFELRQREGAR